MIIAKCNIYKYLRTTSYNGDKEVVKILLDAGANFYETDNDGQTAINFASESTLALINEWIKHNEEPIKEPE
jgi:ankyrin repeat protein